MKTTMIAALALAAIPAFAQDGMMMKPDAKGMKPMELLSFLQKDAYKKLPAPKAYVLTSFLNGLPGNYQTAIARGLVRVAEEAYDLKDKKQMEANAAGPMMEPPMMKSGFKNFQQGERSFETIAMDPQGRLSYLDAIQLLQISQDETDRGLIATAFAPRSFTEDMIPTVKNEAALDAIDEYIKALAISTQPYYLKYTSMAPRAPYAGLPADWNSMPWPMSGR